ncbi:MAG: ribonuclease III [Ignavibacteriae bacterium]|nr:ribonuclease III [Ignavibacteriota bacterium]
MFRLLKILLAPRSTSRKTPVVPPSQQEEEGRVALTATVDFDSAEFTRRTGYHVRHEKYFIQAIVHRSYLQLCPPSITKSNERMEFLGDAILNLVVAEHLYNLFPDAEEGELSKLRARVVSRTALSECARRLEFEDFLLMSPSAHQSIRSGSDSILVDAVEAFVAAIYLDGGYKAAKTFIEDQLLSQFPSSRLTTDDNYKSRLLEFAQARGMGIPRYVTIDESGPDHSPIFTVEVQVNGVPVGIGAGGSKKAAEQKAAAKALEFLTVPEAPGAS